MRLFAAGGKTVQTSHFIGDDPHRRPCGSVTWPKNRCKWSQGLLKCQRSALSHSGRSGLKDNSYDRVKEMARECIQAIGPCGDLSRRDGRWS